MVKVTSGFFLETIWVIFAFLWPPTTSAIGSVFVSLRMVSSDFQITAWVGIALIRFDKKLSQNNG